MQRFIRFPFRNGTADGANQAVDAAHANCKFLSFDHSIAVLPQMRNLNPGRGGENRRGSSAHVPGTF